MTYGICPRALWHRQVVLSTYTTEEPCRGGTDSVACGPGPLLTRVGGGTLM